MSISRAEWEQHVEEAADRSRDINELTLAMFGDPAVPETVRSAVVPTMVRLNTYLDGLLILAKATLAAIAGVAALIGIIKGTGLM